MEGGLIDGKTLRRALGVMTSGQGMVLLGRLAGLSEAEMAEEIGVRESDVAWFMGLARDEVARRAPEAEALLDARGIREGAGHELVLEAWKAAWAAGGRRWATDEERAAAFCSAGRRSEEGERDEGRLRCTRPREADSTPYAKDHALEELPHFGRRMGTCNSVASAYDHPHRP